MVVVAWLVAARRVAVPEAEPVWVAGAPVRLVEVVLALAGVEPSRGPVAV